LAVDGPGGRGRRRRARPLFHPNNSDLTLTGHAEALYNNGNGGTGVELGFAKRLTFQKLASVTVAYRVVISVKSSGQTVHVLDDQIMLGQGRAEGFLNVVAPESNQSQLPAFEIRIARDVVKRLSA
jgi:hypothetical protein